MPTTGWQDALSCLAIIAMGIVVQGMRVRWLNSLHFPSSELWKVSYISLKWSCMQACLFRRLSPPVPEVLCLFGYQAEGGAQALRAVTEVRWQRQLFCDPNSCGSETSVTALTGGGNKLSRGGHVRAQLMRNAIRAAFTGASTLRPVLSGSTKCILAFARSLDSGLSVNCMLL